MKPYHKWLRDTSPKNTVRRLPSINKGLFVEKSPARQYAELTTQAQPSFSTPSLKAKTAACNWVAFRELFNRRPSLRERRAYPWGFVLGKRHK
jgi:hypothetical protein